ncbi:MAG: phosphatidate cytidylyltransferase [Erysipelotrichaceae bacterium]|nr:phosphatidate cytidylyltransferase [Erysipelotrichaceae bacterium]
MKQRIITGLVLIVGIIPPLIIGGIYLKFLIAVTALAIVYEFIKVMNDAKMWPLMAILAIYIYFNLFVSTAWLSESSALLIMVLYTINVLDEHFNVMKIAYLFMFAVYTVLALEAFMNIYSMGVYNIVFLLLITYLTDTFAYFGGMLFGKHKLNERISPKKTLEGSICGYLGGMAIGLTFGLTFLTLSHSLIIISSLLIPILSQIGDLAMSSVKRYFSCKDFSNLFPGHGGVLDRIDSLTFTLLVFNILVRVIN